MSRLLYTRVLHLTVTSEVLEWWWRIDRRLSSLLDGSNSATWSNLLSSISDPILGCIRTCLPCRIRSEYLFYLLHSLNILFWPELTPWHSCYAWERALVRLRVVFVFQTEMCQLRHAEVVRFRPHSRDWPGVRGQSRLGLQRYLTHSAASNDSRLASSVISDQWFSNHLSKC